MSEQRASRVSDIRSFVAEVMPELAVRPPLVEAETSLDSEHYPFCELDPGDGRPPP